MGSSGEAFLFAQDGEIEFKIDDLGSVAMDGSLVQSGSCDLAETFIGSSLEPGTVVAIDPDTLEGVLPSNDEYQATLVGVVSTEPGVLLNGPTADFYPYAQEMQMVEEALAASPGDAALGERKRALKRCGMAGDVAIRPWPLPDEYRCEWTAPTGRYELETP